MQRVLYDYPVRGIVPIQKALAQVGLTPGDMDQLILSHLHFDHAGGLAALRAPRPSATSWWPRPT